jgi:hypothetical protein
VSLFMLTLFVAERLTLRAFEQVMLATFLTAFGRTRHSSTTGERLFDLFVRLSLTVT